MNILAAISLWSEDLVVAGQLSNGFCFSETMGLCMEGLY